MEVKDPFVFQVDSDIVKKHYDNHPNYIIEFNESVPRDYCIVYFSSNDLYYPNNEIAFEESILRKNRFEWYRNRINYGHKHIFIRDLQKQWYLSGINAKINSPEKLIEFLKEETKGYKVIILGSSAGGFISIITGQSLNAERIYSFNGQFEILSMLRKSNAVTDPVVFRNKGNKELLPYYDTLNFINSPSSIYYFHSSKSQWDLEQFDHVKDIGLNKVSFVTSNHGVPFLKTNLPVVLNAPVNILSGLAGNTYHPLTFSLKMVGAFETMRGLSSIIKFALNKIYIRTVQRWKAG